MRKRIINYLIRITESFLSNDENNPRVKFGFSIIIIIALRVIVFCPDIHEESFHTIQYRNYIKNYSVLFNLITWKYEK